MRDTSVLTAEPAIPDGRAISITRAGRALLSPTCLAAAVVLLAILLRFYHLGTRSFWLDEVLSAEAVRYGSLTQIIGEVQRRPDQMPLLDIITWLLRGLGGHEWAVRLPSAVAGSINVLAIYVLGKTLGRPRVALVAALLLAIMPFPVWYSQEARAYAPLMLFTTVQMLFAYRAAVHSRVRDWCGLVLFSVLNLYTQYVALAATAAAFAFVGCVLLLDLVELTRRKQQPQHDRSLRLFVARVALAAAAALATVLAYLPWLPSLRAFLSNGSLGVGRVPRTDHLSLAMIQTLMGGMSFTVLLGLLCVLGLLTCVVRTVRGASRESLLPIVWLAIPVAAFSYKLHAGIFLVLPRYLSFLFPVLVLLAATGTEEVAMLVARSVAPLKRRMLSRPPAAGSVRSAVRSMRPGLSRPTMPASPEESPDVSRAGMGRLLNKVRVVRADRAIMVVIILALLAQELPALAQSLQTPKDDYRGATARVLAGGSRHTTIIAMGSCAPFVVQGLQYYVWLDHSSTMVVDGTQVDDRTVAWLRQRPGRVWAAVSTNCWRIRQLKGVPTTGLQRASFTGITMLTQERASRLSPVTQARQLLQWGSAFDRGLAPSIDVLNALSHDGRLGSNLLPLPTDASTVPAYERWVLAPGTRESQHSFRLRPQGPMVNVTVNTHHVLPGKRYVLFFRYRNSGLHGDQRVYATALGAQGQWLDIFPTGAGYVCVPATSWKQGAFGFTLPAGSTSLLIWLRATGRGAAGFRAIVLRPAG